MAIGDVISVRIVGRYQDQNIVNTLHYQITGQTVSERNVLRDFLDAWDTQLEAAWLARHIDSYELVGIKAFNDTGASKTPAFQAVGVAGSVVGEEVHASVCRTLTLYTDSAKHRRRGRVMVSGSAVAHFNTVDGAVTTAEIALMNVLAAALLVTVSDGETEGVLCIPPAAADPVEIITDIEARVTPSLIRSRRIRQFLIG